MERGAEGTGRRGGSGADKLCFALRPDRDGSRIADIADQRLFREATLARGCVWRRPEDQHAQVFLDAVESVLGSRRHEDKAAGFDEPILICNSNRAVSADHVVDLVLGMRSLAIGCLTRPDGQTNAQLVRSEKVDVAVTFGIARLRIELGNLECFHSTSQ